MSRASGTVLSRHASKNLRRKFSGWSDLVTVSNGANANLLLPLLASSGSRCAISQLVILNAGAISNHTAGTIILGHSTSDGTFDDNSVLTSTNLPANSNAKIETYYGAANFASTLKTRNSEPTIAGLPMLPVNSTLWSTCTEMAANGTGTFRLGVWFWEADDETA